MISLDLMRLPILIAGLLSLAAGVWAIWLNPPRVIGRLFGAILSIKGMVLVAGGLVTASSITFTGIMLRFQHGLTLAVVPLALYFALLMSPAKHVFVRRGWQFALVGVIGVLGLASFLKPNLVLTLVQGGAGEGLAVAGPGWIYTNFGPLLIVLALAAPLYATMGALLARAYGTAPPQERQVIMWCATGLIINGLFEGGLATAYLIHDPAIGAVGALGWIRGVLHAAALVPAGVGLGILIGRELSRPEPARWNVAVPAVLALGAWFSGPMPVILGAPDYGATWPTALAIGFWRGAVAVIIAVGLWQARTVDSPAWVPGARAARPVEDS